MTWYVIISHIALAILLFYMVNWLGKRSGPLGYMQMSIGMKDDTAPMFNYLFKVLAPVVFIILVAALFQVVGLKRFTKNIYLIVVYYWVFRFLYVWFLGHLRLLDWKVQILYWVSSIGLAIWINSLIDKLDTILPSPQSLIEELWILIILFIYSILNKMQFSREETERRKYSYIDEQYMNLYQRFGNQVDSYFQSDFMRALTFSIMIYENYNRSCAARWLERVLLQKSKNQHTYGIMQVMSDHVLTDVESVDLGMKRIEQDCRKVFAEEDRDDAYATWIASYAAQAYNGGDENYSCEVVSVFDRLRERHYKSIPERLSSSDIQ